MRRKTLWGFILLLAAVSAAYFLFSPGSLPERPEPRYEGKALSQWLAVVVSDEAK